MEIECKYKYQNIEKFNGEKYCLCFNDLCKNLSFACDKNCQIFEDYKQLQQYKQLCEQKTVDNFDLIKENEELKRELNNVENDRKWIKEKCIDAGKELGKYSFAWDGKEKNLVIQAMELNTMYEKLKAENKELKKKKEENTTFYLKKYANKDSECLELQHKVNILKQCLDEIETLFKQIKVKDDASALLVIEIYNKIKEVKNDSRS